VPTNRENPLGASKNSECSNEVRKKHHLVSLGGGRPRTSRLRGCAALNLVLEVSESPRRNAGAPDRQRKGKAIGFEPGGMRQTAGPARYNAPMVLETQQPRPDNQNPAARARHQGLRKGGRLSSPTQRGELVSAVGVSTNYAPGGCTDNRLHGGIVGAWSRDRFDAKVRTAITDPARKRPVPTENRPRGRPGQADERALQCRSHGGAGIACRGSPATGSSSTLQETTAIVEAHPLWSAVVPDYFDRSVNNDSM